MEPFRHLGKKGIPGSKNSTCKSPEVEVWLGCLRTSEKASVAGMKPARERSAGNAIKM